MKESETATPNELEDEFQKLLELLSGWLWAHTKLFDNLSVADYRICMGEIETDLRRWVCRSHNEPPGAEVETPTRKAP